MLTNKPIILTCCIHLEFISETKLINRSNYNIILNYIINQLISLNYKT